MQAYHGFDLISLGGRGLPFLKEIQEIQ